jgi:hypothetical protein
VTAKNVIFSGRADITAEAGGKSETKRLNVQP